MRNEDEQIDWEVGCYGMAQEDIDKQVEDAKTLGVTPHFFAMSILSDAQEMLHFADNAIGKEKIRVMLNQAKYIIAMKTESK